MKCKLTLTEVAAIIEELINVNPDGFTVKVTSFCGLFTPPVSADPKTDGRDCVGLDVTQDNTITDKSGLHATIAFALGASVASSASNDGKRVAYIGGWTDKESGAYYVDAVQLYRTWIIAERIGRQNKQLAIFDMETCEEIRLY